jgi:autotransporter-associated beta strand protein
MSITTLRARWFSVSLVLVAILLSIVPSLAYSAVPCGSDTVYVYQGGWSPYIYKTTASEITKFGNADTLPAVATTNGGTLNLVVPTSAGASSSGTTSLNLDRQIFAPVTPADTIGPVKDRIVSDTGMTLSSSGSTTSGGTLQPSSNVSLPLDISTGTMTSGLTKIGSGTLTLGGANTYAGTSTLGGSSTLTIAAIPGGPTMIGSGTLKLSNSTNTYSGFTTISGGTLALSSGSLLQTGTLQAYPITAGSSNLGCTITNVYTPITLSGGTLTIANNITTGTATGSLRFLNLIGTSTSTMRWDIRTPVNGGVLSTTGSTFNISSTAGLLANDSIQANVANNGTLNFTSGSRTVTALSGSGNVTLGADASLTATSVVQDTITLGAGSTLTIAAIPGGPSVDAAITAVPSAGDSITPVPEPSTWVLLLLAALGLGACRRRSL